MYQAVVAKIVGVNPVDKSDFISFGNVLGNTVVVGRQTVEGSLGIFFECDGKLSEVFAKANDLIRYKDPITNEQKGGFFEFPYRVRAQKFRGVKSDGFWIPIQSLEFTGVKLSTLKEGDMFDTINGVEICSKYVTEATLKKVANAKNADGNKKKAVKKQLLNFKKHMETSQFRVAVRSLKKGDLVSLTEKVHGTSQRFGYIEEIHTYPKYSILWFAQKVGLKPQKIWKYALGTRNVVLNYPTPATNGYYKENEGFRIKAIQPFLGKLHKYEVVYFEVVGWCGPDTSIMPAANIKLLKDKQFQKFYGEKMNYSYACEKGNADIFVYRITRSTEDGEPLDLSYDAIKTRCNELGVKPVPELCESFIYDGDEEKLRELVEKLSEGSSILDKRHLKEGVVLRSEKYPQPMLMKSKSFQFKVLEGLQKDDSSYIDEEESN